MQFLQTVEIASAFAHGVHYAIVAAGFLGLVALLAPQLLPGRLLPARAGPPDPHAQRVALLRSSLSQGTLDTPAAPATTLQALPAAPSPASSGRPLAVPLALVSSAAAAGIHAAVGPSHFEEGLLIGWFFVLGALAQLGWAAALLLAPSRGLLLAGALGNLAIVTLWIFTRTLGLPFGLLTESEAVGPWDLAATGWELVTVGICLGLLLRGGALVSDRGARRWHPAARLWLVGSLALIVLLPFVGGGEA